MRENENDISLYDYDELINPHPEHNDFDSIVQTAISRRGFLSGVLTFGAGSFLMGSSDAKASTTPFEFEQIAASTADTVRVPKGYTWDIAVKWDDPMWSNTPKFDPETCGTPASQACAFGYNNDGMALFTFGGKTVLVTNNEYTNRKIIWGNRADGRPETDNDLLKAKIAHGVSIVELAEQNGKWSPVLDSPFNRRITPNTDMEITSPAAGHDLLKTTADPTRTKTKGTWNNCGNGETPWGTYLACEENFNGYFFSIF